jgi:hypothetical protein
MKIFLVFIFSILLSAAATFFLTNKPEQQHKPLVTPQSVSAFSLEDAPSDSLKGEITTMTGNVFWQSRIATEPAQLTRERDILQGENLITKNTGTLTLSYNNAAEITVSPNSELAVIQTLPANIVLTQKSGIADYHKIGTIPLSVQASNLLINQEKGMMTISIDDVHSSITVNVKEGNVSMAYTDSENTSVVSNVAAGNAFVFDTDLQTGSIQPLQ